MWKAVVLVVCLLMAGVQTMEGPTYGVKLCGREFIRAVIFTCGGSRWRRSIRSGGETGQHLFCRPNCRVIPDWVIGLFTCLCGWVETSCGESWGSSLFLGNTSQFWDVGQMCCKTSWGKIALSNHNYHNLLHISNWNLGTVVENSNK